MQPFDALTLRAVLLEAKPLILNRKVDKVYQLGRDEVLFSMRSKSGMSNLLVSAQTAFGRVCLVKWTSVPSQLDKVSERQARFAQSHSGQNQSNFSLLLKKHLTGATLVGVEQPTGERTVDFIFSCLDEVGTPGLKVLTAEIMGRHSNLIFFDQSSQKIIAASHVVTKDMSRHREVAPGLRFVRPPGQEKASIFAVSKEDFAAALDRLRDTVATAQIDAAAESGSTGGDRAANVTAAPAASGSGPPVAATIEQWLIGTFTGLGRHLSEEVVASTGIASSVAAALQCEDLLDRLYGQIVKLRDDSHFKAAMATDLSRYTVLSWWPGMENNPDWQSQPTVNDLIDDYYRKVEVRDQMQQLRERLRSELRSESEKVENRLKAATQHLFAQDALVDLKRKGDLVLANIRQIAPGQDKLVVTDPMSENGHEVTIELNPNMSASQNAQSFYRQYAKTRSRQNAAATACDEARCRLEALRKQLVEVEEAAGHEELRKLKDSVLVKKHMEPPRVVQAPKKKNKSKILSVTSSDGWTIYVGRNRQENDHLLSRMAQPNDLWLHILGQGGAHVLIKVPASKKDPPLTTIKEAAQIAARLSKAAPGSKPRVVYTQCKYVKKIAKDKPGLVRYENEKTLEVDTSQPMPKCMKQLFAG
ncbi:MAG TPA: NFACT RNA binding domain-containing protein [Chroococcales cyanobacterium]